MRGRRRNRLGLSALTAAVAFGLASGPAAAQEPPVDPLTSLPAVAEAELAGLHGREGLSLLWAKQILEGTVEGNQISAGGGVASGDVAFDTSFNSWRGINNVGSNSGNQATLANGLIVIVNVY